MYRYNKKSTSLIFGISLMLGILLFGVFGATFAYFQINNYVEQTYTLGKVGVEWCQGDSNTTISNNTIIKPMTKTALIRGDESGADVAGGMIKIKPLENTQYQYVRIKYAAYIDGVEVPEVSEDLRLRYYDSDYEQLISLEGEDSAWNKGNDGWYYYIWGDGRLVSGNTPIPVCDNIMLVELDQAYLNKELQIKLQFETLQADNNPVEAVWGSDAAIALRLKAAE